MEISSILVIASLVIAYGLVSRRLAGTVLTAPLLFTLLGLFLGGYGLNLIEHVEKDAIHLIAEITLLFVLFGDASRIDLRALKRELGLPVRLLLIGLPLTVALGGGLAFAMFPDLGLWQALLIGAILAPTDAALGQAVVSSKRVPLKIRQALNVESGLNDGIAVPLILIIMCAAGTEVETTRTTIEWAVFATKQLTLGPAVGLLVGGAGGFFLTVGKKKEWFTESLERLLGLGLAVVAFTGAEVVGGNGFIATFLAGLTMGHMAKGVSSVVYEFLEAEGQLLMLVVFLLLGSALAWPALTHATPMIFVYALLSLTVIRMLPTGLSMVGAGLRAPTVGFLGWFGPRGLASILFAIVAVEEGMLSNPEVVFTIIITTVVFSIVAHGLSAAPGAKIYGGIVERRLEHCKAEMAKVREHPTRLLK